MRASRLCRALLTRESANSNCPSNPLSNALMWRYSNPDTTTINGLGRNANGDGTEALAVVPVTQGQR